MATSKTHHPAAAASQRYDLAVTDFTGPNGHPRVAYRAVRCTHPVKPTIVFLCEAPRSLVTSIYNAAEELYAHLKREHGLSADTLYYSVDRKFSGAADCTLLMPLEFNQSGQGSWGSVVNFDRVAAKHGIAVKELKQLCLLPDPHETTA